MTVSQRKVDRSLASQDHLGFSSERSFVVRHPGWNGIQLCKTKKGGPSEDGSEHANLYP
jgi:hypothetical protein